MHNFVRIVIGLACAAMLSQSFAIAANVAPTSGAFKQSQILRDSEQLAVVAGNAAHANDDDADDGRSISVRADDSGIQLSLEDQVRLLTKQMNALMTHRREDFKLLESNLKKSMRKNAAQYADADVQAEVEKLRYVVLRFNLCFLVADFGHTHTM